MEGGGEKRERGKHGQENKQAILISKGLDRNTKHHIHIK
jgi:hypothetical protein